MPNPVKILFVAGDRGGSRRNMLALPDEHTEVHEAVNAGAHRQAISFLQPVFAARRHHLVDRLVSDSPDVVHFVGHGEKRRLLLLDNGGRRLKVPEDDVLTLFTNLPRRVALVFLNTCESLALARRLVQDGSVDFAVGIDHSIEDPVARRFASSFYRKIAEGLTLRKAFELARFDAGTEALKAAELVSRTGLDAQAEILVLRKGGAGGSGSRRATASTGPKRSQARARPGRRAHKREPDSVEVGSTGSTTSHAAFEPQIERVKTAIRNKLHKLKGFRVRDADENDVEVLDLVVLELKCGAAASGHDPSDAIATFLTAARRRDADVMSLIRVLKQLAGEGKWGDAGKALGEIVELLLPLYLSQEILSDAWRQLQEHAAVLIQTRLAGKTGGQLLVSGLHHKPARFDRGSSEPVGRQFVPYENPPIGDPFRKADSVLRELYALTFPGRGGNPTIESMKASLRGFYRAKRDEEGMPCYCVVKLADSEPARRNQERLVAELKIPEILFIGLEPSSESQNLESYVTKCLSVRFAAEPKGAT
jgi:hypothetical protein